MLHRNKLTKVEDIRNVNSSTLTILTNNQRIPYSQHDQYLFKAFMLTGKDTDLVYLYSKNSHYQHWSTLTNYYATDTNSMLSQTISMEQRSISGQKTRTIGTDPQDYYYCKSLIWPTISHQGILSNFVRLITQWSWWCLLGNHSWIWS